MGNKLTNMLSSGGGNNKTNKFDASSQYAKKQDDEEESGGLKSKIGNFFSNPPLGCNSKPAFCCWG